MARAALGVIAGVAVWLLVATLGNIVMRLAWQLVITPLGATLVRPRASHPGAEPDVARDRVA